MTFEIRNQALFIDGIKHNIPDISFIEKVGDGANAKVFLAKNTLLNRFEAVLRG